LTHEAGPSPESNVVVIGFVAAAISGILAVHFMLEFLKRQPLTPFVVYRVVAAAVVFIVLLSPHGA
jgi:undecaprenyl-diphosphatase